MCETQLALSYETKKTKVGQGVKVAVAEKKLLQIIQGLGYNKEGALWISPPGREAALMSALSFQLYQSGDVGTSLRSLTVVRIGDMPMDVLDNIRTMSEVLRKDALVQPQVRGPDYAARKSVQSNSRASTAPEKSLDRFTDNFTGLRHH
jgi:hypothetical protein